MSEKDQLKPFHARDVSRGQETADAVADVLKHAAERDKAAQEKIPPKPSPKWMLPVAMNLGLLAVYFLVAQPEWTRVNPIQPPPEAVQVEDLRNSIFFFGISRIESFLQANGRLPATLDEAGGGVLAASEVEYTVQGDSTYMLVGSVGDEVIVYDSSTMTPAEFTGPLQLGG